MSTSKNLTGLRVAILVAEGFEQVELTGPRRALEDAGADTRIVSPEPRAVQGYNHHRKADHFTIDVALDSANAADFDALLLPGGVANPDTLRTLPKAVDFVRTFAEEGKPIAAICHGPWTLIEAGAVEGRTMTSWPSLRTDLHNAGAHWVDKQVVTDGMLVTSRKPDDLPAFNDAMLRIFAEAKRREPALH